MTVPFGLKRPVVDCSNDPPASFPATFQRTRGSATLVEFKLMEFDMRRVLMLSLGLFACQLTNIGASYAAIICNNPPPELSKQQSNGRTYINGESITFFYKSRSYPVDIYSAYAPQNTAPGANYCIRYEATNKAEGALEKFYWPLAGIQMDYLGHIQNMSIVVTAPPGRPPTIDETRVYAFLNEIARTFAYQKRADAFMGEPRFQLAAIEPFRQAFSLNEPAKYPEVGAEFSSNDDVVAASSRAEWDGHSTEVQISIDRVNSKLQVIAPVTYAFLKGSTSAEVLGIARASRNELLPFFETPEKFSLYSETCTRRLWADAVALCCRTASNHYRSEREGMLYGSNVLPDAVSG
jgi:hypothetical protein